MSNGLISEFLIGAIQFLTVYFCSWMYLRNEVSISIFRICCGLVLFPIVFHYIGVYSALFLFIVISLFNNTYLKNFVKSFGSTALILIISVLTDHIASILDDYFDMQGQLSAIGYLTIHLVIAAFLSLIIVFLISSLVLRYHIRIGDTKESNIIYCIFIFTYLVYLFCIFLGIKLGNTIELIQLNFLFFISYLVFSLVAIILYTRSIRREMRLQQKEREYEAINTYISDLERQYNQMRKFRHDYQNILSSLDSFIEEKDIDGLTNYYNETIQQTAIFLRGNQFKLADLSNIHVKEVKSIIATKLMYAQEIGIDAILEVKEPIVSLGKDSLVLVRIIGIYLDNAIEELTSIKKGTLRVALIRFEDYVEIVIENACRENIEPLYKLRKNGYSTKGDNRGLGLSNVDEMLSDSEKVSVETAIENCVFTQILTINLKGKEGEMR